MSRHQHTLGAAAFLGAALVAVLAAGFAAGLTAASFLASFTGPEGPITGRVSGPSPKEKKKKKKKNKNLFLLINAMALQQTRNATRLKATLRAKKRNRKLTLGLSELALLGTGLDSLVELGIEGALRREGHLVVRHDILLDGLTAEKQKKR